MKVNVILLMLLACMLSRMGYGQSVEEPSDAPGYSRGTVYFGLTYAQPMGSFRRAYPQADALGGTFGILINPFLRPSPVEFGAQVTYLSQGVHKIKPLSMANNETWKTAHSIIPVHFVARIKPVNNFKIKPYIDCLAGISIFNTRTKIKQNIVEFLDEDLQAIVLNKHSNTVLSYGIGAGLLFQVSEHSDTAMDLRFIYLESPLARYVQKGDLSIDQDGYPIYYFTRSNTPMLMVQLSIAGLLTD